MQYVKKPLPYLVEFASTDGVIQTLEGEVNFKNGDAIVTGVVGERWPIARKVFESTYEPCEGSRFGQSGTFMKRKIVVTATQAASSQLIEISQGQSLHASTGDWIVEDDSGKRWIVSKEIFEKSYEPLTHEQS